MPDKNILLSKQKREKRIEQTRNDIQENTRQRDTIPHEYKNKGGLVRIKFETEGRFSLPGELYFDDYNVKDINDLSLAREDDLIETIIAILNNCCTDTVDIGESLMEEFMEILIGMKRSFVGNNHTFEWMCDCQRTVNESDRKLSSSDIDLSDIRFKPISEAEHEVRQKFKEIFNTISEEEFNKYLIKKYGEIKEYTKEQELMNLEIKEPYIIHDAFDNKYTFRFTRVKDIIRGYKLANEIYDPQIARVKYRVTDKEEQKKKLDKLNHELAKQAVLNARALTLLSYNDQELSDKEKIQTFSTMKRSTLKSLDNYLSMINFGIYDEKELTCNLCKNSTRRWLQYNLNPLELLPFDADTKSKPNNKVGQAATIDFYFGV